MGLIRPGILVFLILVSGCASAQRPCSGIAWEQDNLPEEERTGYMGPQGCKSQEKEIPNILFSTRSETLH